MNRIDRIDRMVKSVSIRSGIIVLIIILAILGLIFFVFMSSVSGCGNKVSRFEDLIPQTTSIQEGVNTRLYPDGNVPDMDKPNITAAACSRNDNIVDVCMNHSGCCKNNPTGKCYCDHPFVKSCQDDYKTCINTGTSADQCQSKLQNCCGEYKNKPISQDNFKLIGKNSPSNEQICSLIGANDMKNKCLELCETNPQCMAYSVDAMMCNLYNKIDRDFIDSQNNGGYSRGGNNTNADYYVRKSGLSGK